MIMLDATKSATQKELLEAELEAVGIRLNTQRPNVYFKVRETSHANRLCSTMREEVFRLRRNVCSRRFR